MTSGSWTTSKYESEKTTLLLSLFQLSEVLLSLYELEVVLLEMIQNDDLNISMIG